MKSHSYRSHAVLLFSFFLFTSGTFAQHAKVENPQPVPHFDAEKRLRNALSFFVLGDWGAGGKGQRKVAQAMIAKMKVDGADGVFTTGDNFYTNGVTGVDDTQWESKFENMYPSKELSIPFYATLGNHDYRGNIDAQVSYTGRKLRDGSITRWTMPDRYWARTFSLPSKDGTLLVIGLDTQEMHTISSGRERQMRWLDSVLSASRDEWTVVLGHHPMYSNGAYGNSLTLMNNVKPLFEKYGVDVYFAGHDHNLQLLQPVNGVHYVVSGGGASSYSVRYDKNTIFAATNLGFVWFQVNDANVLMQCIDGNGNVIFAYEIER